MKKYCLKIYGCAMNYADGQSVAGWYAQKGWQEVKKPQEADEVVIISCSVRESAENRVYGLVNNLVKLKKQKKRIKVILTGCMLRYSVRFLKEKLPGVDEFKKISLYSTAKKTVSDLHKPALVSIMEGCNNFCSYCVVPYARGREVSRDFKELVCEVEALVEKGFKEIVLLGQNVNSYQYNFARLLTRLHQIEKLQKISFLTSNPWDLSDDIIQAMKLPKIDRYLHLAVQSGDDEILKKMNRKYQVKDFLVLVDKLRLAILDIQIGTDIIVGFPGETKNQFENTLNLCQKVGFAKAYVSMYSPRPQTAAFKMQDDVSHQEKRRRWLVLDQLINKKPAG